MPLSDQVLGALGHAVVVTDDNGLVTFWNTAAVELYGWTAAEVVGQPVMDVIVPEAMRGYAEIVFAELQATGRWSGAFTARRKDDTTFLAFTTTTLMHDDQEGVEGIIGVTFNLGAVAEVFLRRSHEAALVIDISGMILMVSPMFSTLTGWPSDGLPGTSWWELVHPDDRLRAQTAHMTVLRSHELLPPLEQRLLTADGGELWVDASKTNLLDEPMVRGILITLRDVTERRTQTEQLTHQALHDQLTGLVNRAMFREHLEAHVARRQHGGAVLYIDLDGFKDVNDRYGHEVGDNVLVGVAQRLRETLRPEDVCGRLGGDEFAILLPDVTVAEQASALADRVQDHLSVPMQIGAVLLEPAASVGMTLLSSTTDADLALRLADRSMYERKHLKPGGSGSLHDTG